MFKRKDKRFKIESAEFVAQGPGGSSDRISFSNDTSAPYSASFINLPWVNSTEFDIFIYLSMMYTYFGAIYINLSKSSYVYSDLNNFKSFIVCRKSIK